MSKLLSRFHALATDRQYDNRHAAVTADRCESGTSASETSDKARRAVSGALFFYRQAWNEATAAARRAERIKEGMQSDCYHWKPERPARRRS